MVTYLEVATIKATVEEDLVIVEVSVETEELVLVRTHMGKVMAHTI